MSLLAFQTPPAPRWPLAAQAAIALAAPIAVMSLVGLPQLGFVAGAGAFTVLFKSALPPVDRARTLPIIALLLVASGAASAVAVIGLVPARHAAFQRGTHRMLGTIVGAVLGMVTGLLHPRPASGVSRAG